MVWILRYNMHFDYYRVFLYKIITVLFCRMLLVNLRVNKWNSHLKPSVFCLCLCFKFNPTPSHSSIPNATLVNPPPHLGRDLGINFIQKNVYCNWMKCPELYRKIMFASPSPKLWWDGVNSTKLFLNKRYSSVQKAHVNQIPPLMEVGWRSIYNYCARYYMYDIAWHIMFTNLHPSLGEGWGQF